MSCRGVACLIAIVAALVWAPSSVFAAASNQLSQASVTAVSGAPTQFLVSVRYSSPGGNPATAVRASAGAQVAPLDLSSGSATDGMWAGTIQLPPGSWEVMVDAVVGSGRQPIMSAGNVTVASSTPWPAPPGGSLPSSAEGPGPEGAMPSPSPVAGPAVTPVPKPAITPAPAPARSSVVAAPSQPPSLPAANESDPRAAGPARDDEAPARTPQTAPTDSARPAPASPTAHATVAAGPVTGRDDGPLNAVMLIGMLAVGLVALLGTAWILLAGRRDRQAAMAWADPEPTDPARIAAAIVERRAVRRARLRSSDDPILAAMGLPDDDDVAGPKASSTPPARRSARRGAPSQRRGR